MSIKRFVLISTFIIGSLLIALALIVSQSRSIHQQISVEEQKRINSILLSKELIQSSDDLTRMARGYATTGDPAYKDNFSQILAIRNGQVPRPYTDPSTYWHLKGTDKAHANYTGETISLIDLMRREGLLEEEIMLLEKAKQYSDQLAKIEKQAFAAVDGLVVSDSGEYVATGEHNLVLAQQLLWGAEYIDAKANIMLPVSKFLEKLNQRTQAQFDTQQTKMTQMIIQEIAILIFLFVYLFRRRYYLCLATHSSAFTASDERNRSDYCWQSFSTLLYQRYQRT